MADQTFSKTRRIAGKTYATTRTVSDKGGVVARSVRTGNDKKVTTQTTHMKPGFQDTTRSVNKVGKTPGGRDYESSSHSLGKGKTRGKMHGYGETTVYGKQGSIYSKGDGKKYVEHPDKKGLKPIKKGPTRKPSN